MTAESTQGVREELSGLRVRAHPLRLRMLSLLTGSSFSAMELSREMGISQALASYHLRQLHAAGVIELAGVRSRRGGRERRFRYRASTEFSTGTDANREDQVLFAEAICVEIRRRIREAEHSSTRLGVDAELWVDPGAWRTMVETVMAASVDLHHRARPPRSPGTIRVSVSALLFPMVGVSDDVESGSHRGQ